MVTALLEYIDLLVINTYSQIANVYIYIYMHQLNTFSSTSTLHVVWLLACYLLVSYIDLTLFTNTQGQNYFLAISYLHSLKQSY